MIDHAMLELTMREPLYTLKEVIDLLRISPATAYRMVADGRLPHIRIGRQVRIPGVVVDEMLKKGTDPNPPTQIQEEQK